MSANSLDPYYLLRWDFSCEVAVDRDIVQTSHRVVELGLATDERLQSLIERIPGKASTIQAAGTNPAHPSQWQQGTVGDLSPAEIMDAIENGRYQLTLCRADIHDPDIDRIMQRLVSEVSECHVGLRLIEPHVDLVVSSPAAQSRYVCDPRPSIWWQLRGQCRARVYPGESRFIDRDDRQQVAHQRHSKPLYYEPAFDRHAQVFDVGPAEMISWPQSMPYRIENTDGLNVSLRLTFHTRRSLRQQNIHRVNRRLQSAMLDRLAEDRIDGVIASFKNQMATLLGWDKEIDDPIQPDSGFTLQKTPRQPPTQQRPMPIAPVSMPLPVNGMVMEN